MKKIIYVLCILSLVTCVFAMDLALEGKAATGVIDLDGNEIVKPREGVYYVCFSDTFCLTDNWNKYGYCDKKGKEIIPVESVHVMFPINNMIPSKKNNKIGLYDLKGKLVFPFKYDAYYWGTITTLAPIKHNRILVSKNDEVWGLVDFSGKEIIPIKYYFICGDITQDYEMYLKAQKTEGIYGYFNLDGSQIIPCEYDFIGEVHNNVFAAKKKDKWYVFNLKGKKLFGPTNEYSQIFPLDENTILAKKWGKYGVLKNKKPVLDFKYDFYMYEQFKDTDFPKIFSLYLKDEQIVLDDKGNVLFKCPKNYVLRNNLNSFESENNPNNNLIVFRVKKTKKEDTEYFGIMDITGKIIVEPKYKYINYYKDNYAVAELENQAEVLDTKGNVVLSGYNSIVNVGNGLFTVSNSEVRKNDYIMRSEQRQITGNYHNIGLVDVHNNVILDLKFDRINPIGNRLIVKENDKYQLYDNKGNPISQKYDNIEYGIGESKGFYVYIYGEEEKPIKYLTVQNKITD